MKRILTFILLLAAAGSLLAAAAVPEPRQLDLTAVIQMALTADPQIIAAQVGLAQAEAAAAGALAKISPGCIITAVHNQEISGGSDQSKSITFKIAQNRPGMLPRVIGGQTASEVQKSLWDLADAQTALAEARTDAASNAAQRYLAALCADEQLALSRAALDLAKEDERLAKARLAAGTVTKLDVLKAESSREKAALTLAEAEGNRSLSYDMLCQGIGLPLGTGISLAPATDLPAAAAPPKEADAIAQALAQRADMAAARTAVRKAESALAAAKNQALPNVVLSAAGREGDYTLDVTLNLTNGDVGWSMGGNWQDPVNPMAPGDGVDLGLTLTWQPFDGGVRRAAIAAAEAGLTSARANLTQAENKITLEVRQALQDLNLAGLRLTQARREKDLAAQTRDLAALRYREGIALFSELSQATQGLAQAELGVMQAQHDLFLARIKLAKACGRAWPE